ncbi:MAG: SusD/RagB family nutrient-binding outer membrane lipoprotein [Chitinophagaceae bacterium]
MKLIYKIQLALLAMALLSAVSCKKFVDTNTDPNNPTTPVLELLLPATQVSMAAGMNSINLGTSALAQYVNFSQGGQLDRYTQSGTSYDRSWTSLYTQSLKDIEIIITEATKTQNWGYVTIAKLQKAYIYSIMVDMWGDIPYTDSSRAVSDADPEFISGAAIYDKLFLLIDEALADANRGTFSIQPSTSDIIYKGDKNAWIRMGNSLKLKLLNQIRLVQKDRAIAGINALLSSGAPLITTNAQDFSFRFGITETPANRHPWHRSEYQAGKDFYMGQAFIDRLFNSDDPRLRYYIFRQNATAATGNVSSGNGYYGRYPGDPTGAPADLPRRSVPGIYPAGGLYDNSPVNNLPATNVFLTNTGTAAAFKPVGNIDGSGAGVLPFITNFMVKFIQAEAALTLGTTGNAKTLLEEAITASLNSINTYSATSGNAAPAMSATIISGFTAKFSNAFTAADDNGKLNIVMTQKYIALYGNGMEVYNDYRRTGLPVLSALVAPLNIFPLRLSYSSTELATNSTVTGKASVLQTAQQFTPVFWDN